MEETKKISLIALWNTSLKKNLTVSAFCTAVGSIQVLRQQLGRGRGASEQNADTADSGEWGMGGLC